MRSCRSACMPREQAAKGRRGVRAMMRARTRVAALGGAAEGEARVSGVRVAAAAAAVSGSSNRRG